MIKRKRFQEHPTELIWVENIVIRWMNPTQIKLYNYCGKVMKGGVTSAKEHLMAKKGNIAPCTKTPRNVREELWKEKQLWARYMKQWRKPRKQ